MLRNSYNRASVSQVQSFQVLEAQPSRNVRSVDSSALDAQAETLPQPGVHQQCPTVVEWCQVPLSIWPIGILLLSFTSMPQCCSCSHLFSPLCLYTVQCMHARCAGFCDYVKQKGKEKNKRTLTLLSFIAQRPHSQEWGRLSKLFL